MRIDKNQIITIPNLLSLLRLLLIPVFVLFYLNGEEGWTATLLILSGLTDVIDGVIARKLNQISDVGMVFNPIADKLTQAVIDVSMSDKALSDDADTISYSGSEGAICCCVRFDCCPPYMYRTGAAWHGKLKTLILYGMMIVHVVWQDIPVWVSNMLNIGCIIMMVISLALYAVRNICAIRATVNKDA